MILLSRMWIFSHVETYELEWIIEILKIQAVRDLQLYCPHNASDRNRTGIFAFSRTIGDSKHWPAIHFVSIVVKKGKNPGTTTFHRPSQLSFPDYFVALVQNLRHKTTPTTVILQNPYRPSIEDADANPTVPSFRRVRLRAADWPRDSSSEFYEKNFGKILFGRKKTGSDRLKRT